MLGCTGGVGSGQARRDDTLLGWVGRAAAPAEIVLSVCSGARILGALGLLAGKEVTTHHQVFDHVGEIEPTVILRRDARFVDTGKIITTAGISARFGRSLHVVSRLQGLGVPEKNAHFMTSARRKQRSYETASLRCDELSMTDA